MLELINDVSTYLLNCFIAVNKRFKLILQRKYKRDLVNCRGFIVSHSRQADSVISSSNEAIR